MCGAGRGARRQITADADQVAAGQAGRQIARVRAHSVLIAALTFAARSGVISFTP
jgi:hypothetical protein